ncbi:hypothetical protein AB0K74_26425 [Streptomyces sp. NPDC056159]
MTLDAPRNAVSPSANATPGPGIPSGVFAMVTNDEAEEIGLGRRVELPL